MADFDLNAPAAPSLTLDAAPAAAAPRESACQ